MRKCQFKVKVYKDGRFVDSEPMRGLFHQWGTTFEEFTDGAVQVTSAIIECAISGQVYEVSPSVVQFEKDEVKNNLRPLPHDYQISN